MEPAPEPVVEQAPVPEPASEPDAPVEPVELPTEAGIPVFDENDGVGWIPTRREAPAPPPPFEDKPVKPLFAPEPPEGQPVRRPRPGTTAAQSPDYWPWESTGPSSSSGSGARPPHELTDTGSEDVPGRNWIRLAMALGVGVLVLVAAVAAYHLGSGDPEDTEDDVATTRPSQAASLTPFTGITAVDFDPQGSPPQDEYPDTVPLVLDGDPATSWHTSTYRQDFGPAGLKDGVGTVLDLGKAMGVREIDIATPGRGRPSWPSTSPARRRRASPASRPSARRPASVR
ncbi:hypothetical protein [Nocardioides sp. B-3]|uniref:hypothetical protein n=1 Tax=Nocardioides sp. B-3 TaxID=2895565 RepID=UPI0021525B67|nr:hypothetical protein [Nocardioides sp. B-3]UUZ61103.1 hypothetical protein LP418_10955 [Nocardioides sp. B-3]